MKRQQIQIAPNIIEQAAEEYHRLGYGEKSFFAKKMATEWKVSERIVKKILRYANPSDMRKK